MLFVSVLLYVACLYVRPGEIVAGWESAHILQIISGIATTAAVGSLVLSPRRFWEHPLDKCVGGFFVVAVVSNLPWGWLGGAYVAAMRLAPPVFGYFLVRCGVRSPFQFRVLIVVLVALTGFQALNGIVQYRTGMGLGNVDAFEQRQQAADDHEEPEDKGDVRRIRGTGIFNDPNDLAMVLVLAVPFLVMAVVGRYRIVYRLIALSALTTILSAIYLTNSRGGILAVAAMTVAAIRKRYGSVLAVAIGTLAVAALVVAGPSRMADLGADEESAHGRVDAWSAGFAMLKTDPVLGVGFGQFTDYNDLVAHNSFVHTLGELGLVGGFFFVGMFYWFFKSLRRHELGPAVANSGDVVASWNADAWAQALTASGVGFVACACFLSRQYSEILFLTVALGATFGVVAHTSDGRLDTLRAHLRPMAAVLCGAVATMYLITRLLLVTG